MQPAGITCVDFDNGPFHLGAAFFICLLYLIRAYHSSREKPAAGLASKLPGQAERKLELGRSHDSCFSSANIRVSVLACTPRSFAALPLCPPVVFSA